VIAILSLLACNPAPSQSDVDGTRGGRVDVWFNAPGTRADNLWQPDFIDQMVDLIDGAHATIDFAVMGFTNKDVIDALERAYLRGVQLRMVGDAGHLTNSGYERMYLHHVPMSVGNMAHIMHDKFMVVDGRFVFASTANWSDSDLKMNSNNAVVFDSPAVAADFTTEFQQMFDGVFGSNKLEIPGPRTYQLGDTTVEVWFSPDEDAMGRILEYVDAAEDSIDWCIFAFTKDQLGSAFVRKHEEGVDVEGVIDQSQLHSNGQYHEVYRLLSAGVPVRMDGNDDTILPGDYQAGGGRLHSKTMVIDSAGEHPAVLTGSFNWSSSATLSNDEYLIVMSGSPRIAALYQAYWDSLYSDGRPLGSDRVADGIEPGDVVINEVMWYGVNSGDADGFDEFIELRNTTDKDITLDMWQIDKPLDFVVGFPPGSVIPANGLFTVLDHTLETYQEGAPQDGLSAFANGDLTVNAYNDNRQSRLYINDGALELTLRDPDGVEVDVAGDGGAAFVGGPDGGLARSMERDADPGDGADPASWHACSLDEGGANVNPGFRDEVAATPGEENSPP
jgi:phosphatidylserine/phosphatidylglycerophosphate/cardiolipin synthase-like enzyme